MEKRLQIHFGALADPLTKQLKGLFDEEALRAFDKDAAAITRLHVRQILTDGQTMAARKKLVKQIISRHKEAANGRA
jgi:hypothetical protein